MTLRLKLLALEGNIEFDAELTKAVLDQPLLEQFKGRVIIDTMNSPPQKNEDSVFNFRSVTYSKDKHGILHVILPRQFKEKYSDKIIPAATLALIHEYLESTGKTHEEAVRLGFDLELLNLSREELQNIIEKHLWELLNNSEISSGISGSLPAVFEPKPGADIDNAASAQFEEGEESFEIGPIEDETAEEPGGIVIDFGRGNQVNVSQEETTYIIPPEGEPFQIKSGRSEPLPELTALKLSSYIRKSGYSGVFRSVSDSAALLNHNPNAVNIILAQSHTSIVHNTLSLMLELRRQARALNRPANILMILDPHWLSADTDGRVKIKKALFMDRATSRNFRLSLLNFKEPVEAHYIATRASGHLPSHFQDQRAAFRKPPVRSSGH